MNSKKIQIAHVCTPHGFGHLTRQIALSSALNQWNVQSTFYCNNAPLVHDDIPNAHVINKTADVGIIQHDALHIDIPHTLRSLSTLCTPKALDEWAVELSQFDLVIADLPPLIFAAAKKAKIPVLGIGNFDWVWIYRHFPSLHKWADLFEEWQKEHTGVQLLPGSPLTFDVQKTVRWIARKAEPTTLPQNSILIGFGGLGIQDLHKIPKIPDVTWIIAPPTPHIDRSDIHYIDSEPFTNLVESASIILSKAGYGILAESQRSGTPQIWMHRPSFPEASILEDFAQTKGDVIITHPWGTPKWEMALKHAISTLKTQQRAPQPLDNKHLAEWIINRYSSTFGS
jgi:hypothetical protein